MLRTLHKQTSQEENEVKLSIVHLEDVLQQELIRQIQWLRSLYELTLTQKALVENKEFDHLLSTRSKKEEIIKAIKVQGQRLTSLQEKLAYHKDELTRASRQKIGRLLSQLSLLIKDILSVENQTFSLLEKSREEITRSLFN